jgi:hypothetical protein
MVDEENRLHRQFEAIARRMPATRRVIDPLLHGRFRKLRIPVACALIIGSFFSILPVFGLWMLPLGLLLLAVDVPRLQPIISPILIRARRRMDVWLHRGSSK